MWEVIRSVICNLEVQENQSLIQVEGLYARSFYGVNLSLRARETEVQGQEKAFDFSLSLCVIQVTVSQWIVWCLQAVGKGNFLNESSIQMLISDENDTYTYLELILSIPLSIHDPVKLTFKINSHKIWERILPKPIFNYILDFFPRYIQGHQ